MSNVCNENQVRCSWCGKVYEWDWCQDTVVGLEPKHFVDGSDTGLWLFNCTCGGSLCVVTEEPHGATVLTSRVTLGDTCEQRTSKCN